MKFTIDYQEHYSRGELLLRSFFGIIYIGLPHAFVLMFLQIWSSILTFISFWSILFTGRYPRNFFTFQVQFMNWNARVNASLYNLIDGYPKFGLTAEHPQVHLEVPYPENLSRGTALLKALFGFFYVIIPHAFVLYFLALGAMVVMFINWWVVLFTGRMSESLHKFLVGFLRWSIRIQLYMGYMSDRYPPFTLDEVNDPMDDENESLDSGTEATDNNDDSAKNE